MQIRHIVSNINISNAKKLIHYCKTEDPERVLERIKIFLGRCESAEVQKLNLKFPKKMDVYPKIVLPVFDKVTVSIIVPAYNQWEFTYNCIKQIIDNTADVPYEVILADDVSSDETKEAERYIDNLRVIRNTENLGFVRNCNAAAKLCRGQYILFLNNDTSVQADWLMPLVDLLESDDRIGMVGSKLVYGNGKLQEAGGIFWKDASAWNYGHCDKIGKPDYNYVKEVDYISGASIMIRKNLWEQIGGFDERYVPAYCEDSDLAFEVRKAGYKVVYQPKSVVVHFEGISNGKDLKKGIKKYQVVNAQKFYEKWKNVLEKEHFPNGEDVFWARDRSRNKKTVVVIDHYIPTFDKDAGSRAVYQYIKCLVGLGYNVKLIGDNFFRMEPYATVFENMGVEVLVGSYYAKNWKKWFKANSKYIDFVFLNRPHISKKYIDFIKENTKAKILYHVHDLHFLREHREYLLTGDKEHKKASESWKKIEIDIMNKADVNFTVSVDEQLIMNDIVPGMKAAVMPIFAYPRLLAREFKRDDKTDILFVGGFNHRPNEDAVLWFYGKIWERFKKEHTDAKFIIAGSNPTKKIKEMACDDIIVTGYISDERLSELYANCKLCVIPLRFGAGVKGKIVEAMYHGIGIVSTQIGIEGLANLDKYIPAKDREEDFFDELNKIYSDNVYLHKRISEYQSYIKENFLIDSLEKNIIKYFK